MKKILFFTLLFVQILFGQKLNWMVNVGGTLGSFQGPYGKDQERMIVVDSQENTFFTSTSTIHKIDKLGNLVWAKVIPSYIFSLTIDKSDNLIVSGYFFGTVDFNPGTAVFNLTSLGVEDAFILKLDNQGNFKWAKKFGSTSWDYAFATVTDKENNVYTTGTYDGTTDFDPGIGTNIINPNSAGNDETYILKLDSLGNFNWVKILPSTGAINHSSWATSMTIDKNNNLYLGGKIYGNSVDLNPGPGTNYESGSGYGTFFLLKLDSAGNYLASNSINCSSFAICNIQSIIVDSKNDVIVTGSYRHTIFLGTGISAVGDFDIFIAKYDSLFNIRWGKNIGGIGSDVGKSLAVDKFNNIYLTGYFSDTIDVDPGTDSLKVQSKGSADIILIKLDTLGNYIWHINEGFSGADRGYSLCLDKNNAVYNLGTYNGRFDFDQSYATAFTDPTFGFFVVKYNQFGINGYIYADSNYSCLQDSNETSILSNLPIKIQPGNISVTSTRGHWHLDSLATGNYTATVDTSGQWKSSCPTINFTIVNPDSAISIEAVGVMDSKPFTISGIIYDDFDNDCFKDSSEQKLIPSKKIIIQPGNIVTQSLNGVWRVDSLAYGTYSATIDTSNQWKTNCNQSITVSGSYPNNILSDQNFGMYDTKPCSIKGNTFNDLSLNCIKETGELNIPKNFIVILQPGNRIIQVTNGAYRIDSLPYGNYTLTIDSTTQWQSICNPTQNISLNYPDTLVQFDFGLKSLNPCVEPEISIYAPELTRCFSDQLIYVQACNKAISTAKIYNAYADVEIDPNLVVDSASINYTYLGNNIYRFQLDSISPSLCKNWTISTTVNCNSTLGESICLTANLFPVSACVLDSTPNVVTGVSPCLGPWDQSSVFTKGECLGDSIKFIIKNNGLSMTCFSPYRLYVDCQLFKNDSLKLNANDSLIIMIVSDGKTWRLEADQHPLHPGNSNPNATVEACGDSASVALNWTPGLVNSMSQNDADPIVDIFCGIVSGSFDPNDKKGYPLGIFDEHFILPNQQMQYAIRFQNTGNAKARNIIIRDTLETDLNIFSVVSGVSSHNYTFKIYGTRILEWNFLNINLMDSLHDEPNSHGFVTFNVNQNPNLSNNTLIENSAAIYFDNNAPVITNKTIHTINDHSNKFNVSIDKSKNIADIKVYPNPNNGLFKVELPMPSTPLRQQKITICNVMGQVVYFSTLLNNQSTEIDLSKQPNGIYFLKVENGEMEWNKKVVKN